MPDISLPEVRLKEKLPEGLRDMTMDDIQKAMPDVRLPRIDIAGEARSAGRSAERAANRARKAAEKAARQAAREADKATKASRKSVGREASKAARAVENVLPRRRGPNPVPIAILFMIGGLVVGWILASNPSTGPRIAAGLDRLRMRFDEWRGRGMDQLDDEWDTVEPRAFTESPRAPIESDPFASNLGSSETGVPVGPGELPEGMGTDPSRVGANERSY